MESGAGRCPRPSRRCSRARATGEGPRQEAGSPESAATRSRNPLALAPPLTLAAAAAKAAHQSGAEQQQEHHPPTAAHPKRARPVVTSTASADNSRPCVRPQRAVWDTNVAASVCAEQHPTSARPRARAITIRMHPLRCVRCQVLGRTQPSLHGVHQQQQQQQQELRAQQQQQLRQAPRRRCSDPRYGLLHDTFTKDGSWAIGAGMASVRTP